MGRGNRNPAADGLGSGIKGQTESELIHVKSQASIQIADENRHRLNAEVGVRSAGILPADPWFRAQRGMVCPKG
jgi:hypothetical protein